MADQFSVSKSVSRSGPSDNNLQMSEGSPSHRPVVAALPRSLCLSQSHSLWSPSRLPSLYSTPMRVRDIDYSHFATSGTSQGISS